MPDRRWFAGVLFASACSFSNVNTRFEQLQASGRALDTFHDFEVARRASAARLAELEGLHQLAPNSEDLMLELVRSWVNEAEIFALDEFEAARAGGDDAASIRARQRVESAFTRASFWGREWLRERAPEVKLSGPTDALQHSLAESFDSTEDAVALLWLGHALLGDARTPAQPAARAVLERSLALDEAAAFARAHVLLGRYFSRGQEADLEESRKHFTRAEALTENRYLPAHLYHATLYDCRRGNETEFRTLLDEVLKANDPASQVRLENLVAKRRAQRWSLPGPLTEQCSFAAEQSGTDVPNGAERER